MYDLRAHPFARVLAVDPSTRGFGFAVLEANGRLIEWGAAVLRTKNDSEFLVRVDEFIRRYEPACIAVEDNPKRGERALRRIERLVGYAHLKEIDRCLITRGDVERRLGTAPNSKYGIALELCRRYPELTRLLPPKRRPWMSEDERMNVFDAVGLGITALGL